MVGGLVDPRDRVALEALALIANAITDESQRERFQSDPESVLRDAFLMEAGEEGPSKVDEWIENVPEEVLSFFTSLTDDELQTLAKLQTAMVALRPGFPSLSEDVPVDDPATLGKL